MVADHERSTGPWEIEWIVLPEAFCLLAGGAVNQSHPSASRVGKIVVNVEQLHSDNNLRDARIRAANLQSHDHPLASLSVSKLSGLPAVEGVETYGTWTERLSYVLRGPGWSP